jgi:hypothetical protein
MVRPIQLALGVTLHFFQKEDFTLPPTGLITQVETALLLKELIKLKNGLYQSTIPNYKNLKPTGTCLARQCITIGLGGLLKKAATSGI